MSVDNSLEGSLSVSSDSDSTQNSVENGRQCTVRFRHCEFTFERQIFVDWGKRLSTSPAKSPNPAKKICLQANSNNNLFTEAVESVQIEERIGGVINLLSLFKECYINVTTKDLITIAYDLDLSSSVECCEQIEVDSRLRLRCDLKQLQVGRICGSIFKDVCHSQSKYPSKQLMSRIYQQNREDDQSIKWMKQNFMAVRTKYERVMLNRHKDFSYRKCGLILRPEHPQFCVTPGGIVECSCCGRGLAEFYLPFDIRNERMIYSLSCLDETDDYEFSLRKDTSFYYKIQLHMFLTDTDYCDFVIWTTCDFLDVRIKKDNDFLFVKVNTAKSFFLRKIMPDLLSKRFSGF